MGPGPWKWTQINQGQLGGSFGVTLGSLNIAKASFLFGPDLSQVDFSCLPYKMRQDSAEKLKIVHIFKAELRLNDI